MVCFDGCLPFFSVKTRDTVEEKALEVSKRKLLVLLGDSNFYYVADKDFLSKLLDERGTIQNRFVL